ncbi:SseB family protein [Pseudoxanthomonas mexicana]|jgi:hypothetical protein
MISERELERRLELARQNRELEPAFFRCLLDAKVYAHAPVSDDHPRLRLLQFRHPDGFLAVPFFTSLEKARPPTGIAAKIVPLQGRQFLELTHGAAVMLNPNDGGCVLYPEEIAALLEHQTVARVEKFDPEAQAPFFVRKECEPPAWLISELITLYEGLPFVEMAYLLNVAPSEHPEQYTFLIAVGVAKEHAERTARATITALQSAVAKADIPLDLTSFDPAQGLPDYLRRPGAMRIFGPRE